jgi:hypothetical protein
MIPGKIIIKDKVYFEPDEYELKIRKKGRFESKETFLIRLMEKYEASKQLIEVENVFKWDESEIWTYTSRYYKEFDAKEVINNQKCKAEIKDNKATIISLTKE